jgi:hypothetical protein
MELIKNVVNAAKKKSAENKRTKELANTWKKEQAMKKKIATAPAPAKKPTLGQKPKTHGTLIEAIKSRKDIALKY